MMVSVKMTLLRRSGTRKMLASLESMGLLDAAVSVMLPVGEGVARCRRAVVAERQRHTLTLPPAR
jgi:hypothetical protein